MSDDVDPMPTWCGEDDWCPMVATAAVLGRKWHPVVLHRLCEHGEMGFGELEASIDGVSGKVLSESLDDLEEKGLVEREVLTNKPVRVRYSLSPHGEGLRPALEALEAWGVEYLARADTPDESIV